MTHASLFSGIGAAELAAEWMGWRNAFHCETQGFPRRVLEYWYPNSQRYEDIAKTDFAPWRGRIDVLTGGFPCQPFSCAGKRQGADDDRYLWPEMLRAIREIQPSWVVGENVAGILTMVQSGSEFEMGSESTLFGEDNEIWERRQQYVVETVCQDLENEGYSVQPFVIPACAVGAPHRRDRVFFVARRVASDTRRDRFGKREDEQEPVEEREGTPDNRACGQNGASPHPDVHGHTPREEDEGTEGIGGGDDGQPPQRGKQAERADGLAGLPQVTADSYGKLQKRRDTERQKRRHFKGFAIESQGCQCFWRDFPAQPPVRRRDDGLSPGVDDLAISWARWRTESIKAYGNAIVPQVMYEIFRAIEIEEIEENEE